MKNPIQTLRLALQTLTGWIALAIAGLAMLPEVLPAYWGDICALFPKTWPSETIHHGLLGLGGLAAMWARVRRGIQQQP